MTSQNTGRTRALVPTTAQRVTTQPVQLKKTALTARPLLQPGSDTVKKIEQLVKCVEQGKRTEIAKKSEAAHVVQRYGFVPWQPPAGYYPSEVISMGEFRAHPERYVHRLAKGMLGFPLGLSFKEISSGLSNVGYLGCSIRSDGIDISLRNISDYREPFPFSTSELLNGALHEAGLCETVKEASSCILSPLNFLANAGGIARFVQERPDISDSQKKHVRDYLVIARGVYLAAIELVGKARIGNPLELATTKGTPVPPATTLVDRLKDALLAEPVKTGEEAVQRLFPIQSKKNFRGLALGYTAKILFKGKKSPTHLERAIEQELSKYSTGRLLCLAACFSRYAIEQYESHDQAVERVLAGGMMQKMSGQCFHYTALAAHYLQQVIMPMLPEAFHGFRIGYEEDHIGKHYDHVFFKALRINPDRSVDVYFLDPTMLAAHGIKALQMPQDIARYANTKNLPIQITRTAEDLLRRPVSRVATNVYKASTPQRKW